MSDPVLATVIVMRDMLSRQLAAEEAYIAGLIASAVATKSSLPDHYWQKRHGIQRRLETANAMVEVLKETSNG